MKTLKEYETLDEAIKEIEKIILKAKKHKEELKLSDEMLISNVAHELDTLLHYKVSDGRKGVV